MTSGFKRTLIVWFVLMGLFLIVVMLLNLGTDDFPPARMRVAKLAGAALGGDPM